MEKEYAGLIIDNLLMPKDYLFICISKKNEKFAFYLLNLAMQRGVKNIQIDYYENPCGYKIWSDYMDNNARFLFVFENGYEYNLSTRIFNAFMAKERDIDFLAVPSYDCLSRNNLTACIPKDKIELGIILSENNKIIAAIKNYKINRVYLHSLVGLDITMTIQNKIKGIRDNTNINTFPNYGYEFMVKDDSANGYINATDKVKVDGLSIDELKMSIKNGILDDFDCENYTKEAKELFKKSNQYKIISFSLAGYDNPIYGYDKCYNNVVLDNSTNSYITIESNDSKRIKIPISSSSLIADAYTMSGKSINLYKNETIGNKFLIKK